MRRAVIAVIVMMALILLVGGCAQETVLRPGETSGTPASTAAGNAAAANSPMAKTVVPAAKPIPEDDDRVVPGQWDTLYCNLVENDLRREADTYQDDVDGNQERLSELDDEITQASGAERTALQGTKRNVQSSLTAAQGNLERIQAMLADALAKCKKLDDRKDAKICTEFKADLALRITDAQEDLKKEQAKVQFITDAARMTRQQRKILDAQQSMERLGAVRDNLFGRC